MTIFGVGLELGFLLDEHEGVVTLTTVIVSSSQTDYHLICLLMSHCFIEFFKSFIIVLRSLTFLHTTVPWRRQLLHYTH